MRTESFYSPVVWIAHEYKLSGANYSMLEFVRLLSEKKIKQILIVNRKGPVQEAAETLGVEVQYVKFYGWVRKMNTGYLNGFSIKHQLRNFLAIVQLARIILKTRAGLVVTSTSTLNVGAWASWFTGRKHFWRISEFGEEDFGFRLPWGKFSYRFMELTSERILLNSMALKRKYERLIKNTAKLKVVYNPVIIREKEFKTDRFSDSKSVKLLLAGQINRGKGHLDAIMAVEKLNAIEGKRAFYLTIVGNTPNERYLKELKDYIDSKSLERFIKFQGFTKNMDEVMCDHDLLLMCSRAEAFGRVTAEAMKRYLPVVGTNSGGTTELIEDGKNGLLYEPGNTDELVSAILKYANGEVNYKEFTSRARHKIIELTNKEHLFEVFTIHE